MYTFETGIQVENLPVKVIFSEYSGLCRRHSRISLLSHFGIGEYSYPFPVGLFDDCYAFLENLKICPAEKNVATIFVFRYLED